MSSAFFSAFSAPGAMFWPWSLPAVPAPDQLWAIVFWVVLPSLASVWLARHQERRRVMRVYRGLRVLEHRLATSVPRAEPWELSPAPASPGGILPARGGPAFAPIHPGAAPRTESTGAVAAAEPLAIGRAASGRNAIQRPTIGKGGAARLPHGRTGAAEESPEGLQA